MAREFDWNRLGRRVMIDVLEGIIELMSYSSTHAELGDASNMTVSIAGPALSIRDRSKRGTCWNGPGDPENIGLEPETAFYVGDNAVACYAMHEEHRRAVPDLQRIMNKNGSGTTGC